MMIFSWILIVLVFFYLFSNNEKVKNASRQESPVEDILKMRYIKGEINEETFEKMKKTIRN